MHPQIEALFDEAETRYLKPEELTLINQYVGSLPARLDVYRTVRDRELEVMQWVADQLQTQLPQESVEALERSLKNALLVLRYCAMGMLLDDEAFVQTRLLRWMTETLKAYDTRAIDEMLYRLLNQRLVQTLSQKQASLFIPQLQKAEIAVLQSTVLAVN
jgi:hypothetical protein